MFSSRALFMIMFAAALAAAGCSTTKPDATPTPDAAPAPAPAAPAPEPAPMTQRVTTVDTTPQPLDPLKDANGPLARRSVYFDFDKADVKAEYAPLITAHGEYLGAHHQQHVRIEGNCDERGSREYNLALGARRADEVKERLLLLGTLNDQAETISFGEEKPRALGHDAQAWAENRRADIVYRQ